MGEQPADAGDVLALDLHQQEGIRGGTETSLMIQVLFHSVYERAKQTDRRVLFAVDESHYLFEDRFGRPGKGNDKGNVEGLVGFSRRNFMVPIPRFATWDAFNAYLEEQCRRRQADVLRGQSETIGERLARDLVAMSDLPASPFDACDQVTGRVNSQALVRYKTNDYSVPVAYGHRDVWIRGYVDAVVIGSGGEVIARVAERLFPALEGYGAVLRMQAGMAPDR